MAVSYATFERLKSKGVTAYKKGEYAAAKTYLAEAAECMVELAEATDSSEVRRQREEIAAELIDLAKDSNLSCAVQGLYSKCFADGIPCKPKAE